MTTVKTKTSEDLLRLLHEAAKHTLTKDELHRQRVSFILGSLPPDSTITRQQIEKVLAKSEGEPEAA